MKEKIMINTEELRQHRAELKKYFESVAATAPTTPFLKAKADIAKKVLANWNEVPMEVDSDL